MFIVKGETKAIRLKKQSQGQRAWRAFRSEMISALAQIGCRVGGLFTSASTRNKKLKHFSAQGLSSKELWTPRMAQKWPRWLWSSCRDRSASRAIHTWLQPLKIQQAARRILLVWIMAESFWIQTLRGKKNKILMFSGLPGAHTKQLCPERSTQSSQDRILFGLNSKENKVCQGETHQVLLTYSDFDILFFWSTFPLSLIQIR